jgi:predicted RNase H-like HicB family nuclease
MKFTIAIEPGTKDTAFGVVVPDLPGCFSAGDTVEDAFDNVREAIETHCELLAESGSDFPVTKSMSDWQNDPEYAGWMWGIVDVPVEKLFGPAEKINITVPARILKRIDDFARQHGETRSGLLVRAAEQVMRINT